MREDRIFASLRKAIAKPKGQEARKSEWVSEDTWRIVNNRVYELRDQSRNKTLLRRLGHTINASLKGDRNLRTEKVVEVIDRLLGEELPTHKEAWNRMNVW